jgi:hypothetical protein
MPRTYCKEVTPEIDFEVLQEKISGSNIGEKGSAQTHAGGERDWHLETLGGGTWI